MDSPRAADVSDLIARHVAENYSVSPAESVHVLGADALTDPRITLWSARDETTEELLGIGALKRHSAVMAELKSMCTAAAARRRGVAAKILATIITECRKDGVQELKLETGIEAYFAPARAFYERFGFVRCEPFASYVADTNSVFLSLQVSRFE